MTPQKFVALALADTLLARNADQAELIEGVIWSLGKKWRWAPSLCRAILQRTGENFHFHTRTELAEIILAYTPFAEAWHKNEPPPQIRRYCLVPPITVEQPPWLLSLSLPTLVTPADLALWLNTEPTTLD